MASPGVISLPLLLLLIFQLPLSALAGFWYLNCGSSNGFNASGITWIGDEQFVKSGESVRINNGTSSYKGTTMRVFPKNKKNCYTIPVGKDNKVYVRVGFYYGNYDGRNNPPTFELILDGTDWSIVKLSSEDSVTIFHAIYVTRSNDTNICFGRLYEDQDPVVFSLRLSVLDRDMYSGVNSSYALYYQYRYAFGANGTIRYPDDRYDRFWYNTTDIVDGYITLKSNLSVIYTNSTIDNPPVKMFSNAIVPAQGSRNLSIKTTFLFTDPVDIYMNMYFAEMSDSTGPDQKRAFHIYKDNDRITNASEPITPRAGNALEFTSVLQATDETSFTLIPTSDSVLPPIISGFEVQRLKSFSQQSANSSDVNSLTLLQNSFKVLNSWTGDPCLPVKYNWEWVICNSDESPRITKLYLDGLHLSGEIPDFSALDALITIDMHNNNLNGSIPEFFNNFPELKVLNLANNDFSSIPDSLKESTTILLNVTGNSKLCDAGKICLYSPYTQNATTPPPSPSGSKIAKELTTSLLVIALLQLSWF